MKRIGGLLALFLFNFTADCGTRSLPAGDADRGREAFHTLSCVLCHSVNGEGGKAAPDLGQSAERGFSPYQLASLLWNHAPAMWAAMEARGIARPELSEQQAADLFVYFFAARYFEKPGDAGRGRQIFRSKGCDGCHGMASSAGRDIRPLTAWPSIEDPIALAQRMWSHTREMQAELKRRQVPYPRLSSQELTDVLAYVRTQTGSQDRPGEFTLAAGDSGRRQFELKGCAACHRGALALEARPTRYSLTDFAAAMWNHAARAPGEPAPLSCEEMQRLVGYLVSMQFFEERGDLKRGRSVFERKRCGVCHDHPSSGAPPRADLAGRMTSYAMVAALWKHGPTMLDRMRQQGISWPRFTGTEMADLTGYLHGLQLKRRAPPPRPEQESTRTRVSPGR